MTPVLALTPADWLALFGHFMSLSLLAVGGAITVAPDMHRLLVDQRAWLTDMQFTQSIAIAQAAPGPNVLFIALLGWHVGLNAGGWPLALLGVAIGMTGILIPSCTLTYVAARWGHRNQHLRAVRAFKQGLAPLVIALLIATGYILATAGLEDFSAQWRTLWPQWAIAAVATVVVWRTKLHMLWLLGGGAVLGVLIWG